MENEIRETIQKEPKKRSKWKTISIVIATIFIVSLVIVLANLSENEKEWEYMWVTGPVVTEVSKEVTYVYPLVSRVNDTGRVFTDVNGTEYYPRIMHTSSINAGTNWSLSLITGKNLSLVRWNKSFTIIIDDNIGSIDEMQKYLIDDPKIRKWSKEEQDKFRKQITDRKGNEKGLTDRTEFKEWVYRLGREIDGKQFNAEEMRV